MNVCNSIACRICSIPLFYPFLIYSFCLKNCQYIFFSHSFCPRHCIELCHVASFTVHNIVPITFHSLSLSVYLCCSFKRHIEIAATATAVCRFNAKNPHCMHDAHSSNSMWTTQLHGIHAVYVTFHRVSLSFIVFNSKIYTWTKKISFAHNYLYFAAWECFRLMCTIVNCIIAWQRRLSVKANAKRIHLTSNLTAIKTKAHLMVRECKQ